MYIRCGCEGGDIGVCGFRVGDVRSQVRVLFREGMGSGVNLSVSGFARGFFFAFFLAAGIRSLKMMMYAAERSELLIFFLFFYFLLELFILPAIMVMRRRGAKTNYRRMAIFLECTTVTL